MNAAFSRPKRRNRSTAVAVATQRPWVKPQAGRTKTTRKNRDGSITVFVIDVDRHGVIRRSSTTVVPQQ
jgi:hypothetical protein